MPILCTLCQIGRTPLHLAAFRGHAGISLELLRHGADPGAVTHDNSTAAALAAAMGHEDTAEMLLAHLKETIRNSADISMLRLRGGMQIGSPQGVAGTPRVRPRPVPHMILLESHDFVLSARGNTCSRPSPYSITIAAIIAIPQ